MVAICVWCNQQIVRYWYDGDDDRLAGWGTWHVRTVTIEESPV